VAFDIGSLITSAREILKDSDEVEYRYSTESLVSAINSATTIAFNLRPDLFKITEAVPYYTGADVDEPFPLPLNYYNSVLFYVVGHAEMRDDEYSDDARAKELMAKLEYDLMGRVNAT
jgi:hypothetical protein